MPCLRQSDGGIELLLVFVPEEGIEAMTKYVGRSEHKSDG